MLYLRGIDTFSGETIVKIVYVMFRKRVYFVRKEFAPSGSKVFPYKVNHFRIANTKSQVLCPLAEMAKYLPNVFRPLKIIINVCL